MQRYWGRIALGALAVFCVGMIVITMARHGLAKVEALAKSDRPIGIPLALLPFRLEGGEIGTVRRLELLRSSPKTVTGIRLTVRLQDSSEVANLERCAVTLHDPQAFGGRDGFVCSSAADSAAEHLQQVGELVLEPGGQVRAILAPARHAAQWRRGFYDTAAAKAELAGLKAERLADSTARAVVIRADSSRAIIDIRGDSAHSLLQLQADSHGAMVRIRDRSGKEVLHMHADSTGASFSVSADSVSRRR